MTPCARIPTMGCHFASADLLLFELYTPDHAHLDESDVGFLQVYILQRELLDELALLRLPVCAVGVE